MYVDQSQVILVSKVVKATAMPCTRLKGFYISRLYTSGPAFPKIRKYLSQLSKASVMTKFLMLDSLALPLKESTQDCSFSFHFACLFRHLSIFSRQLSSPQHQSRYLKGTSAFGRQICILLGPERPKKLDSQAIVQLLYFSWSLTSVQRFPSKVDSRVAMREQLPKLSRRQKTYYHLPSFRTVIMCSLVSCSNTWYSVIPDRLFFSRWIQHCMVWPFGKRSKIEVLSKQQSDFGMDFMDLTDLFEGLACFGFSSMKLRDWMPLVSTLSFQSMTLILLACLTSCLISCPLKFQLDCRVQFPWLPSSRMPQSSPFKSRRTSAFLDLS